MCPKGNVITFHWLKKWQDLRAKKCKTKANSTLSWKLLYLTFYILTYYELTNELLLTTSWHSLEIIWKNEMGVFVKIDWKIKLSIPQFDANALINITCGQFKKTGDLNGWCWIYYLKFWFSSKWHTAGTELCVSQLSCQGHKSSAL